MQAVVFKGRHVLELEERPSAEPGEGELLMQVKACGICGTDQHIYHGLPGSAAVHPPLVLGHELSGIVTVVGPGVSSLSVGTRVSVDPNMYCRSCRFCRSGRSHLCERMQAIGVTRDGGMAQFCAVPAVNAYPIPDAMTFEEAAMIEPLGCVLHGIRQLHIRPGAAALIIGGGYIGLMMLQLVKMAGAFPVWVSEPDQAKRQAALSMGADEAIDPGRPGELDERLRSVGGGADIVIECVGRQETMEQAVRSAGRGGQVLLFGVAAPEQLISVSAYEIFTKELTIRGSFVNPHTHEEAISLISQQRVRVLPLISHRFDLADVPEAMENYTARRAIKGIILP